MATLLPCPFCGGEAKYLSQRCAEDAMMARVECSRCGVSTDSFEDAYAPTGQAIAAWNTRTPSGSSPLPESEEIK